jgi:Leucine rich repeat
MLEFLNLHENKLTGMVPDVFPSLPRLKEVNLAWNNFTGTIHDSFGSLAGLSK